MESRKKQVLIIDDDPDIRWLLQQWCATLNLDTRVAATGERGLAALNPGVDLVDLVLLDLELPGINGLDVTERIRALPETADVPILMLTGRGDEPQVRREAFDRGVSDIMGKPFSLTELEARATALLTTNTLRAAASQLHDILPSQRSA